MFLLRYFTYDTCNRLKTQTVTDKQGDLIASYAYTYTSYGELTDKTGNTDNPYLYTGEYYDENTGFYYLRARYMNPETGSFISLDTYQGNACDPASLHKYNYAQNNPQMYKDPSGHFVAMIQLCVSEASRAILENWNYLTVSGMVSGMMSSIVARVVGANPEEAFIFGFLAGMGMAAFHFTMSVLCVVTAFCVLNRWLAFQ